MPSVSLNKINTFFIVLVLFGASISPSAATAASAPPTILSYQGRLADSGGNLLGGAGTTYYFQFSLWTSPTVGAGTQVWPASTPATTTATVTQGVFNVNVGDTANGYPDVLNINFANYPQLYLQVQVSANNVSSETLTPRQQLTSAIYAQVAGAIVGSTTASAFGTTTSAFGSFVTIAATSSNTTGLTIVGAQSQSANLLQIQSNAFTNLFNVSSAGALTVAGSTTVAGIFNAVGGLSTLANVFAIGSSTIGGAFSSVFSNVLGSTTLLGSSLLTNATTSAFAITNAASCSGSNALTTTSSGSVICGAITGGAGGAFPFTPATGWVNPANATSTLIGFTGGLYALASSTIGNGTASGGLTISGSATTTGNLTFTGANAFILLPNAVNQALSFGTSTGNAPAFTISTRASLSGLVGVGTSTPWGKFSLELGPLDPAFVIANQGSSSPAFYVGGVNKNGNVGIGTSTPFAKLSIQNNFDDSNQVLFAVASSTATTNSTLFNIMSNGRVGIGTSSPWAMLAVNTGNAADESRPAFVIATTTNWLNGLGPLFYVGATTTGAQDFARVAIGTTSPWGTGGLRDQLTVGGRVYSTWRYLSCDHLGSTFINATAITATAAAGAASVIGCGAFGDQFNVGNITPVLSANPPYAILQSENAAGATASHGVALRTGSQFTASGLNPVFETWAYASTSPTSTSTPMYYTGFTSTLASVTLGVTLPTDAVYFIASSSQNWKAVTRKGSVETDMDTGVSTSTAGAFQKMRIELTSTNATFLINGNVVAVSTTNIPLSTTNLAPVVEVLTLVAATNAVAPAANSGQFRVSLMRAWSDDPANPSASVEAEQSMTQAFNPIDGADIAEADLVDNAASYIPGMLVSNATSTLAGSATPMVSKSLGRYDSNVLGVVSSAPHTVLGQETGDTVRVALVGRVPVIVSLENGGIHQGDRIAASSIEGVGMRAARASNVVGVALSDLTLLSTSTCDASLATQLTNAGVVVPDKACLGTVMVQLKPGSDLSIGNVIQDIGNGLTDMASALAELTNAAFSHGAELTKYVVGELVAKIAVVGELFANRIHTKEICVTDDSGASTCIKKAQLDALLLGAGAAASSTGGGSGDASSTPPTINMSGNNPSTVTVGSSYNDLGATAVDAAGHDLTVHTFVNGLPLEPVTIDTSAAATDTIDYVATDTWGNTSTSTRTVVVQ